MGQAHHSGEYFHETSVKEHFACIQTLWSEDDLISLLNRLKDMTLNFSLDKVKFAKLLQLSTSYEALVGKWFEEFSHDRASHVVDGLEFISATILISSKVDLFRKILLLFNLFDLDKTGVIRKDEFTIFLKAVTTGLNRMVNGLPPPASVLDLGSQSSEFFASLSSQMLAKQDLLCWMTEAHFSLHYLSVLSKLGTAIFAWGTNRRYQLGLNLEPREQTLPAPVLTLEGIRIASIASNESHTLFLTSQGRVWSCGSGFCGILGHGDIANSPQPRLIESLAHSTCISIAVGVRHSAAISEKGQIFTWGAADMYQLGHGASDDLEIHESSYDPKTGGTFSYVTKPTVVMDLFGKKILGKKVSCCNFSTVVLTDTGQFYTWGNNTDGQCGQGQKCPDHKLVYVEPHMHRTAMQTIVHPKRIETEEIFKDVSCGGYHVLAIDAEDRLWTWGQGMWGKLGHGDQRSMYDPKLVECMKYHITHELAAGESHSLCLCSLYRVTITGGNADRPLSAFSLLGLPIGRVDRHDKDRRPIQPPNTTLQLNAFASARLMQIGIPFKYDPLQPIIDTDRIRPADILESVVLMDRALWEGEWLKLATTDFDFCVKMSHSGAQIPTKGGVQGPLVLLEENKFDAETDLQGRVCVFYVSTPPELQDVTSEEAQAAVVDGIHQCALACYSGRALACVCILPPKMELFAVQLPPGGQDLRGIGIGVMSHAHGEVLKKHVTRLVNMRIAESPDGVPEEVRHWTTRREEFTGRPFFENTQNGQKRWAPPVVLPRAEASLLIIREDSFLNRLKAVVDLRPRAVIVTQQSWRPDVELVNLPDSMFNLDTLDVPIVQVTYEAGEELKSVIANGADPWATMEMQHFGGVCAWGNGTAGQLGLTGIENQNFLQTTQNTLTHEESSFTSTPKYVAHLHEHQVVSVACGAVHTTAVTHQGEVFSWGAADGLGVPCGKPNCDIPMFVDQLEGLVRATKAFAGHHHSFVTADMPFKSLVE